MHLFSCSGSLQSQPVSWTSVATFSAMSKPRFWHTSGLGDLVLLYAPILGKNHFTAPKRYMEDPPFGRWFASRWLLLLKITAWADTSVSLEQSVHVRVWNGCCFLPRLLTEILRQQLTVAGSDLLLAQMWLVFCQICYGGFLFMPFFFAHSNKDKQVYNSVWRLPSTKKQLMCLFASEFQCRQTSRRTKTHY